jgi:hypothetical protein
MRKTALLVPALLAVLVLPSGPLTAADIAVGVGVTIGDSGPSDFHLAVCEHYHVHHDKILVIQHRHIPDEHIPVVFFLAEHARVAPEVILDMRVGGKSWMDISLHFGLGADIFYVPVVRDYGPPYGNAFGHYKRARGEWGAIRLADDDVVTLVNVKFLSTHHGMSADDVMDMRQKEGGFVKASGKIKLAKAQGGGKGASNSSETKTHGNESSGGGPASHGKGGSSAGGSSETPSQSAQQGGGGKWGGGGGRGGGGRGKK